VYSRIDTRLSLFLIQKGSEFFLKPRSEYMNGFLETGNTNLSGLIKPIGHDGHRGRCQKVCVGNAWHQICEIWFEKICVREGFSTIHVQISNLNPLSFLVLSPRNLGCALLVSLVLCASTIDPISLARAFIPLLAPISSRRLRLQYSLIQINYYFSSQTKNCHTRESLQNLCHRRRFAIRGMLNT
jgi:hypothetical protein